LLVSEEPVRCNHEVVVVGNEVEGAALVVDEHEDSRPLPLRARYVSTVMKYRDEPTAAKAFLISVEI
jgi:hypothetical protein